jgi:thiamine biosynthesis lipoprotein
MKPTNEARRRERGRRVTRRRVLTLIGAAGGLPLIAGRASRGDPPVFEWRGQALGAEAQLLLAHPDAAEARLAAARCVAEIARLERVFSLFDPASELSRLNRDGRLAAPSHDLRVLLAEARRFGALSNGAFDVTVQPLWRLAAAHFARPGHDPEGPSDWQVAAARALVDYRNVDLARGRIAFRQPGMGVTLNGIAQGYITDRATDLLRESGFDNVLVQLGETRALGRPAPDRPWRVAVPDPLGAHDDQGNLDLVNRAVAVSSGTAARFDTAGRHHHLFDPATGASAARTLAVTVIAGRATTADALSTALSVAPPEAGEGLLRAAGAGRAVVVLPDGAERVLNGSG